MANLGYWQMKVSPGVWYLQLAPGRSSELYVLNEHGVGNQDSPTMKRITIRDLRGKPVHLEVHKKKGKEQEKLLVSTENDDESAHELVYFFLFCVLFPHMLYILIISLNFEEFFD